MRIGRGDSRFKNWTPGEDAGVTTLPYSVMALDAIDALPVQELVGPDAHLYLWTTSRFLRASYAVAEAWGFRVSCTLVWCKAPRGFNPGGTFGSTVEFVQFCRRGTLAALSKEPSRWFAWPRHLAPPVARGKTRNAKHSEKPPAFLDMVERVSPGPYVELFARAPRLGWDSWGYGYESRATSPTP